MNFIRAYKIIFISVIILIIMCANGVCNDLHNENYNLSVPKFIINKDERIVEFKVTVQNGFVVSVPKIPIGWFMNIKLPTQSKTVVFAGSVIGVADLTSEEASYFNNFLIIQTAKQQEPPLDIEVEVVTTNDLQSKKSVIFKMNEVKLTKL